MSQGGRDGPMVLPHPEECWAPKGLLWEHLLNEERKEGRKEWWNWREAPCSGGMFVPHYLPSLHRGGCSWRDEPGAAVTDFARPQPCPQTPPEASSAPRASSSARKEQAQEGFLDELLAT